MKIWNVLVVPLTMACLTKPCPPGSGEFRLKRPVISHDFGCCRLISPSRKGAWDDNFSGWLFLASQAWPNQFLPARKVRLCQMPPVVPWLW